MARTQSRAAAGEKLLAQRARRIVGLVAAAPLQLGHQQIRDIGEGLGRHDIGEVEAVEIGLRDPAFHLVRDLGGRAHEQRPEATDAHPFRDLAHRPGLARIGGGERFHRRMDRLVADIADRLIEVVGREVDAGPAGDQRQRAGDADIAAVVGVLLARLLGRATDDGGGQVEDLDRAGIAAIEHRPAPDIGDIAARDGLARCRHEDAFGVAGGEVPPLPRGSGLEQHRRALRGGFAQMDGVELEERALMPDAMDLRGIGEEAARPVPQHGAVFPAAFPELVDEFHVFFGDLVARVVARLLRRARDTPRGAVQIAGDDVPADAPLRQVIERRHAPREGEGRLVGERAGDAEAQVLRHRRHGRDGEQRVIQRDLRGFPQRIVGIAAIDVVHAQNIGQEERIELAALQDPREVGPIGEIDVAIGAVARVPPQPRRLMHDAVHVEGVEQDLARHGGDHRLRSRHGAAAARR
jgi:hypothetical protein